MDALSPLLFGTGVAVCLVRWSWPLRWLLSGTPILSFVLVLGSSRRTRVLPFIPLWTLLTTLNLVYAVASTSWLLYGVLSALVYPSILVICILQFDYFSNKLRRLLRKFIKSLHVVHDTIALFDLPALEIDKDVDGLMVIRGMTISLSTLTVVAHGVEVGIKLTDDIELAISVERVTVALFRRVVISDCYANIKGGEIDETTFGELEEALTDKDEDGDSIIVEHTPLLQAAAGGASASDHLHATSRPSFVHHLTGGAEMEDSEVEEGLRNVQAIHPEDRSAHDKYDEMLKWIRETNCIERCRQEVKDEAAKESKVIKHPKAMRGAICSKMQTMPSIAHPPERSIKVTTLENLSSPRVRRLLHRMPFLLRCLLAPISYLHPVSIASITASGSGRWISYLLKTHLFKDWADDNRELRKLEKRVLAWLAGSNFVFEMDSIRGLASVPFSSSNDIQTLLRISDIIAYRSLVDEVALEEVVRLGGADATFTIPSFLLPHHEHLLPPLPTPAQEKEMKAKIKAADGKPEEMKAARKLIQKRDDEANVRISAHVQLPACFSQDLLNFIAALVKASKVIELEKEHVAGDHKLTSFKDFGHAIGRGVKDGMKRSMLDGMINDRWIAKMVGKGTKLLETAMGDLGYSGDIPVKLEKYRLPEGHPEANKILP